MGGSKGTWFWGNDYIHDSSGKTLVEVSSRPFPLSHTHYAHDHLGTPVITTNQNGVIIGTDSLWAFGEPVDPNGSFTLKRFTGHERDYSPDGRTFDLDYMHARYYVPQMGRFLSVDPVDGGPNRPQSWNKYSYSVNNPLVFFDPQGRFPVAAFAELGFAVCLAHGSCQVDSINVAASGRQADPLTGLQGLFDLQRGRMLLEGVAAGIETLIRRFDSPESQNMIPLDISFIDGEFRRTGPSSAQIVGVVVGSGVVAVAAGSANQQVRRGQAPSSVQRVDKGRGPNEQDHAHFKGGHALNRDGSWKHGGRQLTNSEKRWLRSVRWNLPQ